MSTTIERERQAVNNQPIESPMNVEQAAKFLHRSKAAIYTMVCRGQLKANKFAGQLYFFPSELVENIRGTGN